jgi:hypothetical protein
VDFVGKKKKKKKKKTFFLGKTETKNSLGNGGDNCMPYKREMN